MATVSKKRKYVLFNKEDGRTDAQKPCAFFITPQGCRNGSKCPFIHGDSAGGEAMAASIPAPHVPIAQSIEEPVVTKRKPKKDPVVAVTTAPPPPVIKERKKTEKSSSSSQHPAQQESINLQLELDNMKRQRDLMEQQLARQQQLLQQQQQIQEVQGSQQQQQQQEKKKRRKSSEMKAVVPSPALRPPATSVQAPAFQFASNPSPHSYAVGLPVAPIMLPMAMAPPTASLLSQREEEDDTQFLFGAVNTALAQGSNNGSSNSHPHNHSDDPFVHSESVMRLLQTSGTKHATLGAAAHVKQTKVGAVAVAATTSASSKSSAVTGTIKTAGTEVKSAAEIAMLLSSVITGHPSFPWGALAQRTKQSPRFQTDYNFETDHTWVQTRPHQEWLATDNAIRSTCPAVIAIDCEMCETSDPVTGIKDPASLVRISVINGIVPIETLLDSFVAPGLPVSDWRTHIHGIAEKDLAGVTFTLRHAQAFILNICSDRTIVVGHAVHHDLKALRVQHTNVIDTAYFYSVENEPGHHASVRDIAEQVLGIKLPQLHDSAQDARAALQAAAYICKNGAPPPIVRKALVPVPSLLVHRIPDFCSVDHVRTMLVNSTNVVPSDILPITRGVDNTSSPAGSNTVAAGKTTVTFTTQEHADLAFNSIPGPNKPDKSNRAQKRVYLKGGGYICIRKF